MSRSPQPAQIKRLQRLATLKSDAARQAMVPLQQQRTRILDDIEKIRETLRQSRTSDSDAAALVGQSLSAQRYAVWCQNQLAGLQREAARLEVKRIPLAQAMAQAEARRLILDQMAADTKAALRAAHIRTLEDGTG